MKQRAKERENEKNGGENDVETRKTQNKDDKSCQKVVSKNIQIQKYENQIHQKSAYEKKCMNTYSHINICTYAHIKNVRIIDQYSIIDLSHLIKYFERKCY